LSLPRRLAPQLALGSAPAECEQILQRGAYEALESISADLTTEPVPPTNIN